MKRRIAVGFQNTVDFELIWDSVIIESLVKQHQITCSEIRNIHPITSERDLLLVLLYHMNSSSGSECLTNSSVITRNFAAHFSYNITLGGTAIRAAIAADKIGFGKNFCVHACSLNHHFQQLVPKNIHWVASVPDEGENFHPHIIIQYPAGAHIQANDINIATNQPNRVIFTCDPPSCNLEISPLFTKYVAHAQVFLIASFNIIKDKQILKERINTTLEMLESLPTSHVTIMEDGCFKNSNYRQYVAKMLAPVLDIFSMNEDELQDRYTFAINILDSKQVAKAIRTVYKQLNGPTIVCHSAYWALAYGPLAPKLRYALEGGITMAATRFRLGNNYNNDDYEATKKLHASEKALTFCNTICQYFPSQSFLCFPCKDLSHVETPVTIGLGDAFIGGMLPQLLPENMPNLTP